MLIKQELRLIDVTKQKLGNKVKIQTSLLILAILTLVACSDNAPKKQNISHKQASVTGVDKQFNINPSPTIDKPGRFSRSDLIGYTFENVDKTIIDSYSFITDKLINADMGVVNGPVTAPTLEWIIDSKGRLVVDYYSFKEIWTKLYVRGDLIDVKIKSVPGKPDRVTYNITLPDGGWLYDKNSHKGAFSAEELSGNVILLWYDSLYPQYRFNPDGSGAYSEKKNSKGSGDYWRFQWSVNTAGLLLIKKQSGKIFQWRKISRNKDVIVVDITDMTDYPSSRKTFRRVKRVWSEGDSQYK